MLKFNPISGTLDKSFSGVYADLTGKPTLGTAAATAATAYATAAQGATADAALAAAAAPELIRDTMATALVAGANVTITPNDGADTITIAASGGGGGGGGVSLLQFWGVPAVTEFVPPAIIGGHVNFTCHSGYMYLCPLIVGETMNIDQAKVHVDTGVAGATLTLGLYKMVGGVMTRTNVFGTVSAATSGAKTISLTPFSLDPGFVYSALLVTGGSSVTVWGGGPAFGESMTSKGDPSVGTNWLGQWYSAGNATLPATMPHGVGTSVSNPSVPKVGLRRSA